MFREERRDVRRVGDTHMGGGLLCETWAGAGGVVRSLSRRGTGWTSSCGTWVREVTRLHEVTDEQPQCLSCWPCLNLSFVVFARICLL